MLRRLGVFASENGRIYTPPVSRPGLAKLLHANAHHGAIPKFQRNMLLREFIPSAGCSAVTMGRASLDFMVFGEAYFYARENVFGQVLELEHLPTINMWVKVDGGFVMLQPNGQELEFDADEVVHVMDYDVEQNIYGVPDYLSGLQAPLLNEAATLFAGATTATAPTPVTSSTPTIRICRRTMRRSCAPRSRPARAWATSARCS